MAEIVQRMSEMEGGQWGEGGTEGRRFAKYNKFFNKTHTQIVFFLQTKHTQKKLLNKTCKNRRKKKGEQRGDALQNTTICEQNIQKL